MNNRRIAFVLKALSLWLLGALAISIPLSRFNLVKFYYLNREGVRTNGVVTDLQAANHQAVYYKYEVVGEIHSGSGRAGFGNPDFFCLRVGQNVTVYYLRSQPSESCLGIPDDLIKNEVPPIALAVTTFPIFAMVVCSYRIPGFKRWLLA